MFKMGDLFSYNCPYTGGHHACIVTEVTETEIKARSIYEEIDGTYEVEETYKLGTDEQGQYIEIWKIGNEIGKVYAK